MAYGAWYGRGKSKIEAIKAFKILYPYKGLKNVLYSKNPSFKAKPLQNGIDWNIVGITKIAIYYILKGVDVMVMPYGINDFWELFQIFFGR